MFDETVQDKRQAFLDANIKYNCLCDWYYSDTHTDFIVSQGDNFLTCRVYGNTADKMFISILIR